MAREIGIAYKGTCKADRDGIMAPVEDPQIALMVPHVNRSTQHEPQWDVVAWFDRLSWMEMGMPDQMVVTIEKG